MSDLSSGGSSRDLNFDSHDLDVDDEKAVSDEILSALKGCSDSTIAAVAVLKKLHGIAARDWLTSREDGDHVAVHRAWLKFNRKAKWSGPIFSSIGKIWEQVVEKHFAAVDTTRKEEEKSSKVLKGTMLDLKKALSQGHKKVLKAAKKYLQRKVRQHQEKAQKHQAKLSRKAKRTWQKWCKAIRVQAKVQTHMQHQREPRFAAMISKLMKGGKESRTRAEEVGQCWCTFTNALRRASHQERLKRARQMLNDLRSEHTLIEGRERVTTLYEERVVSLLLMLARVRLAVVFAQKIILLDPEPAAGPDVPPMLLRRPFSTESKKALDLHDRMMLLPGLAAAESFLDSVEATTSDDLFARLISDKSFPVGYKRLALYHFFRELQAGHVTRARGFVVDALYRDLLLGRAGLSKEWTSFLTDDSVSGTLTMEPHAQDTLNILASKGVTCFGRVLLEVGSNFQYQSLTQPNILLGGNEHGWQPCPPNPADVFGRNACDPMRKFKLTYTDTYGLDMLSAEHIAHDTPVMWYGQVLSGSVNIDRPHDYQSSVDRGDLSHRHRKWENGGSYLCGKFSDPRDLATGAGQWCNHPNDFEDATLEPKWYAVRYQRPLTSGAWRILPVLVFCAAPQAGLLPGARLTHKYSDSYPGIRTEQTCRRLATGRLLMERSMPHLCFDRPDIKRWWDLVAFLHKFDDAKQAGSPLSRTDSGFGRWFATPGSSASSSCSATSSSSSTSSLPSTHSRHLRSAQGSHSISSASSSSAPPISSFSSSALSSLSSSSASSSSSSSPAQTGSVGLTRKRRRDTDSDDTASGKDTM